MHMKALVGQERRYVMPVKPHDWNPDKGTAYSGWQGGRRNEVDKIAEL